MDDCCLELAALHWREPANRVGQVDVDRGFMHNNPEGPVREAWFHLYGCRRWIYLTRDTRSDEVLEVE